MFGDRELKIASLDLFSKLKDSYGILLQVCKQRSRYVNFTPFYELPVICIFCYYCEKWPFILNVTPYRMDRLCENRDIKGGQIQMVSLLQLCKHFESVFVPLLQTDTHV